MAEKQTVNIFSRATNWIISVETDLVRLICVFLPWLVPSIPAWLVKDHAEKQMAYTGAIPWIMGIVAEGLGLASLVTSLTFWTHNRKYTDENNRMPLWIPITSYVFYLIIVIAMNVILDIQSGVDWTRVLVVGMFSLLSLPAGLLISVQTIFNEWTEKHEEKLAQTRATRLESKNKQPEPEPEPEPEESNLRKQMFDFLIWKGWLPSQVKAAAIVSEMENEIRKTDPNFTFSQTEKDNMRKYRIQFLKMEENGEWPIKAEV